MVINSNVNVRVCDVNYTECVNFLSGKSEKTSKIFVSNTDILIGTCVIRSRTSLSVTIVEASFFLLLLYKFIINTQRDFNCYDGKKAHVMHEIGLMC
jgi:hypothetical protein